MGNGNIFYFFTPYDGTNFVGYCFGQISSYKSADAYHCANIGSTSAGGAQFMGMNTIGSNTAGWYMARISAQTGGSVNIGSTCGPFISYTSFANTGLTFPNFSDYYLYLSAVFVHEGNTVSNIRGVMPGLWIPQEVYTSFTSGDTFTGSGSMAGKTFEFFLGASTVWCMETSNTW
jgi:hypothetical protein